MFCAFNLTAGLAEWTAAQDAIDEYVAAWGEANDVEDAEAADITTALNDAELELEALDNANDNVGYDNSNTDAVNAAYISLMRANFTADVTTATTAATAATTAVNAVANLKTAVDAFIAGYDAAVAAEEASIAADNAQTAALLQFQLDEGLTSVELSTAGGVITVFDDADAGNDVDAAEVIATYTIATGVWADGVNAANATAAVKTAVENAYDASEAAADALELADIRLDVVNSLGAYGNGDGSEVTAGDMTAAIAGTETAVTELAAGIAATYAGAAVTLADAQELLADFEELVAAVDAAAEDVAGLDDLQDASNEIVDAIEVEGYDVAALANGANPATASHDVFLLSGLVAGNTATITNFNFAGTDVIVASGFAQGDDIDAGDDAVLEFFVEQNGANAVITFETEKYGSDLAIGTETYQVVLAGVAAADVSFSNGYILIA